MMKRKLLLAYSLATTLLLVYTLRHYDVPHKLRLKYFPSGTVNIHVWPGTFLDNSKLTEQLNFTNYIYTKPHAIVMLGTSLTYRVDWKELLGRNDVATRAVGNDITAGLFYRLPSVLKAKPKICFIEGGVNDISLGVGIATINSNLQRIVDTLKHYGITPVLQTITYISDQHPRAAYFQRRADSVNAFIKSYCASQKISLLNLCDSLSANGFIKKEYVQKDGVHFTAGAYKVWVKEVQEILSRKEI